MAHELVDMRPHPGGANGTHRTVRQHKRAKRNRGRHRKRKLLRDGGKEVWTIVAFGERNLRPIIRVIIR